MGQRQALLLATFLTTFGLILIGAVAVRLTAAPAPQAAPIAAASAPIAVASAPDGAMVAPADPQALNELTASREAAFRQALAQANAQLEAANQQLAQARAAQSVAPATAGVAVPPAVAAEVARAAAPHANPTAPPTLVDFQGIVAYEIATDAGVLYVDANSGALLHNGAQAAPAQGVVAALAAPVGEAQALEIAAAAVGSGAVERIRMKDEHGFAVWEIRFQNDNEVTIDATNGAVLEIEIENDGD